VFERYTEGARRAIFFARYEASQYGSPYIETEHLLLGTLREDKRLARSVLRQAGAAESIRKEIEAQVIRGKRISTSVEMPLSAESKRVLQYAANSAEKLGHRHVDTVHLLLGILREENCTAARILRGYCVESDIIEQRVQHRPEDHTSKVKSVPDVPMSNSLCIELQLTVEKFLEAWHARDAEKVSNFFEDDGQFWNAHGDLWLGPGVKAGIEAYFAAPGSEVGSPEVKDILVIAEGIAAVTISWSSSNALGKHGPRRFHLAAAMREDAGGWYVVSAHVAELKVE